MKKTIQIIIVVLGVVVLGLALMHLMGHGKHGAHPLGESYNLPMADFGPIPAFQLTNQNNSTYGLDDLKGKTWVANFIFTRCTGPCPVMSTYMADLSNEFDNPNVRFISLSVDPQFDTPDILKAYSKRYKKNEPRWFFLTGETKSVHELILDGFRLAVQENIDPNVAVGEKINHSLHFVLVDDKGHARGYYNGYDTEARERLKKNLVSLL